MGEQIDEWVSGWVGGLMRKRWGGWQLVDGWVDRGMDGCLD